MRINKSFIIFIVPFLIVSCGKRQTAANNEEGDTLIFKYAHNICVVRHKGYTKVTMSDPWNKGKILHSYTLVRKDSKNKETEQDIHDGNDSKKTHNNDVVKIPISNALITTSVHCELLKTLGKERAISGVCDIQYMNSPWIHQQHTKGKITDCGNSMAPDIEKIIDLSPEAIFLSPFQNNGGYGKISEIGIPVIELADYMESTPLGRAEWVKFYGILFGCEKQAEAMFEKTERHYIQLKNRAKECKDSPLLLMDKVESGTWFLPGGKSTIAQLIADANIRYFYSTDKSAGSIRKSKESVIENNSQASLWLMRYYKPKGAMTQTELLAENKSYSLIKAFTTGNVYGCNTATSRFFEETPFRPDLLLRDFILAAHPEAGDLGKMRYFFRMEK